jgi:hypothetical protein
MTPEIPKRGRPPTGVLRTKKHVTFDAEVLHRLEQEALQANIGLSDVVEGHIKAHWQHAEGQTNILEARLDQLSVDLSDLRAKVLPLVATVTALLRQMEGELPVPADAEVTTPKPRIVTQEEMYGPITPVPPPGPVAPPAPPTRRRRWPW